MVDFTAGYRWKGSLQHRPTILSELMRQLLEDLPATERQMVRLVVGCMKRNNVCWDRRSSIKYLTKGVHLGTHCGGVA